MSNRLDAGEIKKLVKLFPEGMRELWPATEPAPLTAASRRALAMSLTPARS
jgi:hypothetical protein